MISVVTEEIFFWSPFTFTNIFIVFWFGGHHFIPEIFFENFKLTKVFHQMYIFLLNIMIGIVQDFGSYVERSFLNLTIFKLDNMAS